MGGRTPVSRRLWRVVRSGWVTRATTATMAVVVLILGLAGPAAAAPAPVARLSVTPASGVAPLGVSFDTRLSSGTIDHWRLSFGDGTPDATGTLLAVIPHTYAHAMTNTAAPKTYTATFTVWNSNRSNAQTSTATQTVSVTPALPVAFLSSSTPRRLTPFAATFTTTGTGDPDEAVAAWRMSFGDATPDRTGTATPPTTISHAYDTPGVFPVRLTVTDTQGLTATATITITGTGPPQATLIANTSQGSAPLTVTFTSSGSGDPDGPVDWQLAYGDGTTQSGSGSVPATFTHTYTVSGPSPVIYTATLAVTDTDGNQAQAISQITVSPVAPTARLTATPVTGLGPLTVTFNPSQSSDPDDPIAAWRISFGDGTADTTGTGPPPAAVVHTYTNSGPYTATLTVTDSQTLTNTAAAQIRVLAAPTARLTVTPISGAAPLTVTFNPSQSSDPDGTITTWRISFGDGTADTTGSGPPPTNVPHSYTRAGSYTPSLTVTDNDNLTNTAAGPTITVQASAPVVSMNTVGASGYASKTTGFYNSASDPDGSVASWRFVYGDGSPDASGSGPPPNIFHVYPQGLFTATLTVTDNSGLSTSKSVLVDLPCQLGTVSESDSWTGPDSISLAADELTVSHGFAVSIQAWGTCGEVVGVGGDTAVGVAGSFEARVVDFGYGHILYFTVTWSGSSFYAYVPAGSRFDGPVQHDAGFTTAAIYTASNAHLDISLVVNTDMPGGD